MEKNNYDYMLKIVKTYINWTLYNVQQLLFDLRSQCKYKIYILKHTYSRQQTTN